MKLFLLIGLFSVVSSQQNAPLESVLSGHITYSSEFYNALRNGLSTSNLITSPLSVSTVSAMLLAGAGGDTAAAIKKSFRFPENDNDLNTGYQSLLQQLRSDSGVTLEMANRIFPAAGFSLNPTFISTLKSYYGVEPQQLNYNQPQESATTINNFVANATQDNIKNLIPSDDLDPNTRIVLVNAIYFRATWEKTFLRGFTQTKNFYTSEESTTSAEIMNQGAAQVPYAEIPELDAKAISLSYKGGNDRFSMLFILPNKRTGLTELENKLENYPLDRVINSLNSSFVDVSIPKFRLESTLDLKETLTKLGTGVIFSNLADLSNISQNKHERLQVSKAIQKAFLEVNEEGSVAAAATGFLGVPVAYIPPQKLSFNADHPFRVALLAQFGNQHVPLFIARVANPQV